MSKQERNALRKEKNTLRQASQSAYVRQLMDDMEGRPEEVSATTIIGVTVYEFCLSYGSWNLMRLHVKIQIRETFGSESAEVDKYRKKWEERAQREEELFIRAPLTKEEKKREKHLKKSRNGYAQFKTTILFHRILLYLLFIGM